MTLAFRAHFNVECPVHSDECGARGFGTIHNVEGNIVALCEKCGYQFELCAQFGVRYRRMDDPSIVLSREEFERNRP